MHRKFFKEKESFQENVLTIELWEYKKYKTSVQNIVSYLKSSLTVR